MDCFFFYHAAALDWELAGVDRFENETKHSLHTLVIHDANKRGAYCCAHFM